jgi:hypothetical protein
MMFHRWCRLEQTHATAHLPPEFEPQSNNMTQQPSLAKALGSIGLRRLGAGATVLAWLASGLTEIKLDGVATVAATGQHIVIRADKADAENSLDQPDLITPKVLPLTHSSKCFQVTLPPYSVNVLRIQAK